MEILAHFSCYTKLPVRIGDVHEFVVERGIVDHVEFVPADLNPEVCGGFLRIYEEIGMYGQGRTVAHIFYSKALDDRERRVVLCKELLHVLDGHKVTAQSLDEVNRLIDDIIVPLSMQNGMPGVSDHTGLLHALGILMPRDALDELRPQRESGKLTTEAIATLAQVPEGYVEFLLSPQWARVLDRIK